MHCLLHCLQHSHCLLGSATCVRATINEQRTRPDCPVCPGSTHFPTATCCSPLWQHCCPAMNSSNNNMKNVMQPGWLCPFKRRCHPPPHGEPPTCRSAPFVCTGRTCTASQPSPRAEGRARVTARAHRCAAPSALSASAALRLQFGSVRVSSALLLGARACLGCLALWRLALPLPLSLALSLPLLLGESMPALTAPLTLQFNLKRLRVRYVLQRQRQRLCVTVTATVTVTVTAIL